MRSLSSEIRASTVRSSRCASVRGVLVDGDDLHSDLAGADLGAGDTGRDLAALTQYPRPVAVRRIDACVLDDLPLKQIVQLFAFGAYQLDLLLLGGQPGLHALDLLSGLADAELELFFLAVPAELVAGKQAAFSLDHAVRGARSPHEVGRKFDRGEVIAFRGQPRLAAHSLAQLRAHDEKLRLDLDVVQRRQHLSFPNEIALPNRERLHDASVPMLHLLKVLVDLHGTGGDNSAFKLRERRPSAAAEHQQDHECQTAKYPWPEPEGPFRDGGGGGQISNRSASWPDFLDCLT